MTHRNRARLSKLSLALIVALAAAPAFAQSTSAGVGGHVAAADGQAVAGAEVTITHVASGTVSRAITDANGNYTARGLRVGGPYTITINKAGAGTSTQSGVYLGLNQVADIDATLNADVTTLGGVAVYADAAADIFNSNNKGVGTSISGRELEIAPQSSRSIDDIARLDPRITVTDQASGAISVAGVNNRFNNISVDGLSQGDPFGLNANGMPYTGSPISVDTIAAYDIKVSDFDVTQDTVGATVNAVTKSGTNEFHGSLYYVLKDAGWGVGDGPDNQDYTLFDKDQTKGLTVGGPIVKDKLFFFGSYEEQNISDFGGDSSNGLVNGNVSQDEIDRVIAQAPNYGMTPGEFPFGSGINLENKRYLAKIDWNISDNHRASLTYQRTEESRPSPYDDYPDNVLFSSHWYDINNVTRNVSAQLFSDWTDNFSTEIKVSQQKFDQVNGNHREGDQPEMEIKTADGGSIFIGEDDNRHENQINTDRVTASIAGTYYAGDHVVKGGFDYLRHDVYNLYGKQLHGAYVFNSIGDFESGNYYRYYLRRPASGYTEADTAAAMVYSQFSPFIQDTWQASDNLSLTYGVRVNIPKVNKAPVRMPGFEDAFGFPNDYKLGSSNKVVLPRFAFNYTFDTERYSQLRGGIGMFQSVPPFVWLANPYQNNGVTAVYYESRDKDCAAVSGDAYNQNIPDQSATGCAPGAVRGSGVNVDAIDPDFKLPTVWKLSLGYDRELPWMGLIGTAEIQHIANKDGIFYKALNIGTAQGTLSDGRLSYWCANGDTNCGAIPGFQPGYPAGSTLLSNTDKGESTALTLSLDKPMANGWYGNVSFTLTHATEVGSDGSSQAWSSYQYVSRVNPNEEVATTATRNIPKSLKVSLGWEHAFFGDYKTSISAYYNGHDGLPYTWIFNNSDANGDSIRQDPAYIPLLDDPNVSYGSATPEQIAAFQDFIDSDAYLSSHRGQIAARNDARMPWVNQLDLGIQQELPGFFKDHKSIVRLDIYNFLNMLNSDWGQTMYTGGFDTRNFAGIKSVNPDGTYVYNLGSASRPTYEELSPYDAWSGSPSRVVSRWSAQLTFRYEF
jgi:hypothetical protein